MGRAWLNIKSSLRVEKLFLVEKTGRYGIMGGIRTIFKEFKERMWGFKGNMG